MTLERIKKDINSHSRFLKVMNSENISFKITTDMSVHKHL